MKVYTIMKNGKYVKDWTEGEKLTTNYNLAEKYTNKKSAEAAARQYGKAYGTGFYVV